MPNIASILKAEITRLARKEVRAATEHLRKLVVLHRSDIAALKRRSHTLEQELRRLRKTRRAALEQPEAPGAAGPRTRFSAKSLASQRRRLGLSANDCGLLLGASGQSVYNWEAGTARPRPKHMPAIAALRTLGKKEAAAIVASRR
jgi:DNA-binding transcriptional regulator YiaG